MGTLAVFSQPLKQPGGNSKVSIRMDTPQNILSLATSVEALTNWAPAIVDSLEGPLSEALYDRENFYLLLQVTIHPNKPPTFKLAGNPIPSLEAQAGVQQMLDRFPPPTIQWLPVTLSFSLVGGNAKEQMNLLPPPNVAFAEQFKTSSAAKRVELMRRWAREDALTVMAAYCSSADPSFKGVTSMGAIFTKAAQGKLPADYSADTDPHYWRSITEMAAGAPMTVAGRIFMEAAEGRFAHAENLARFIIQFTNEDCAALNYLKNFLGMMGLINQDHSQRIEEVTKLIDASRHKDALAAIHQILAVYPYSATAYHEQALIYSRDEDPRFAASQEKVFQCNPMYAMKLKAFTGKEAYQLGRRMKLKELFKKPEDRLADMMTMGHIALDLEEPHIAGTFFWHLAFVDRRETQHALNYFLYSMEKAGQPNIKKDFKGNWPATFKAIDEQRQKAMEDDTFYKSMAEK